MRQLLLGLDEGSRMGIRKLLGIGCLAAGVLFLTINSVLLGRGAMRWGIELWEQVAYFAVAATVPWVIAIMPFLVASSRKTGTRFARPTMWTLVGCVVWLSFAAYNLIGASGAIGLVRSDVIATRKHDARTVKGNEDRRAALQQQRDAIPAGRPEASVAALITAATQDRLYIWSQNCTQPINQPQRVHCQGIEKLRAEAGASKERARLEAEIERLDLLLAGSGPVAETADPQAALLSDWTGVKQDRVAQVLPLLTPLILELGSMFLLGFAIVLYGYNHHQLLDTGEVKEPKPEQQAQQTKPQSKETSAITRQVELAQWFFGHCTRAVKSGALPESQWYAHYKAVCERSGDTPLPVESFRRIAAKYMPTKEVAGQIYYLEYLPIIPANAA